jgi:hypothetical protein
VVLHLPLGMKGGVGQRRVECPASLLAWIGTHHIALSEPVYRNSGSGSVCLCCVRLRLLFPMEPEVFPGSYGRLRTVNVCKSCKTVHFM